MGNNCAIFLNAINATRYETLSSLTGDHFQMTLLLDKIIYWWQNSEIEIEGHTWTTRLLEQISQQTKIPLRSIERYLKKMQDMGLIVKQCFKQRVKRLYIRVTHKVLEALGYDTNKKPLNTQESSPSQASNPVNKTVKKNFNSATMAESIYKEKERKKTNFVSESLFFEEEQQQDPVLENQTTDLPVYPIESTLNEKEISESIRLTAKTVLQAAIKHGIVISSPNQVFAEIIFSLTNPEQFKGISDIRYKINIISKLLREGRWTTPRGFFKHAEYAKTFIPNDMKQETSITDNVTNLIQEKTQELVTALNHLHADVKGLDQMISYSPSHSSSEPIKIQRSNVLNRITILEEEMNALRNIDNPVCRDWVFNILIDRRDHVETQYRTLYEQLYGTKQNSANNPNAFDNKVQQCERLQRSLAQYKKLLSHLAQTVLPENGLAVA